MAAAICNSRAGIGPFGFALGEPVGRVPGWDFSFVSSFVTLSLLMAQSLVQQKVADLPSGALTQRAMRTRKPGALVSRLTRFSEGLSERGRRSQRGSSAVYLPCSTTKFPASTRLIPC